MENTVRERLMRFIRYRAMSVRAFEQSIGASNSYVRNSGNSITMDFQRQIFSKYPDLNRVWLLTGEGEMLNLPPRSTETTVRERLTEFIRYKGMTVSGFEERVGLSPGYVKNICKSVGRERLEAILARFPDLSRDWLLYGEGEMLRTSTSPTNVYNANVNTGNMSGGNTVIAGGTIGAGAAADVSHYVAIIEAMSRQLAEAQRQMGVLLDHLTRDSAR